MAVWATARAPLKRLSGRSLCRQMAGLGRSLLCSALSRICTALSVRQQGSISLCASKAPGAFFQGCVYYWPAKPARPQLVGYHFVPVLHEPAQVQGHNESKLQSEQRAGNRSHLYSVHVTLLDL